MADEFSFSLQAKRTRLSDSELIEALQFATGMLGEGYFTSTAYDGLVGKRPHSATIIDRFGSWKKALALIGITGGKERHYSPEELVSNLEAAWKQLGYPPGKRKIASLGAKISESPYKRRWGSMQDACIALAAFHEGKISKESLLAGRPENEPVRTTIPLKDRWAVLKRDNYRCVKCGANPSSNHEIELEVDHIFPVAKGGGNSLENLQVLCRECNQGKKDR